MCQGFDNTINFPSDGFMEVELMVTKRDDNDRPTDDDRVNIEQSASGRWALGRQSFAIITQ